MERLPKKYFGSISDYVKTYYTAWGVTSFADKAYTAIKTVTMDFIRTDPVYVRVGEDGEPEIHYNCTKANMSGYFRGMTISGTLFLHNTKVLTSISDIFRDSNIASFGGEIDCTNISKLDKVCDEMLGSAVPNFVNTSGVKSIGQMFGWSSKVVEIPAYDFSGVSNVTTYAFTGMTSLISFKATGLKVSFALSGTALKHDAILEVFNNLGTVDKTAGITLTLGSAKLALMSDEEKAIATEKGWFLA